MTQEHKQLLFKDLCARLPYNVIVLVDYGDTKKTIEMGLGSLHDFIYGNADVKPYLRPMSSMTEDEENEKDNLSDETEVVDWLLKNHFDFRGLIPMGLALEALRGMYN